MSINIPTIESKKFLDAIYSLYALRVYPLKNAIFLCWHIKTLIGFMVSTGAHPTDSEAVNSKLKDEGKFSAVEKFLKMSYNVK